MAVHELGDVLDPVDDMRDSSVLVEHRGVDRAPVPFLEVFARIIALDRNVIALQRHGVGVTGGQGRFQ
ncbi:MAG TPA: hypothetical protein VHH34_05420 [Pseudonocardiaceae bacterium]|nr:hypothetical protein [Pseudonocardiaceae bacterium]